MLQKGPILGAMFLRSFGLPWIVLGYLGPSCGYLAASVGIPWISLGYLGPSCGYLFLLGYLGPYVRPSLDHLGPFLGHLVAIGALFLTVFTSNAYMAMYILLSYLECHPSLWKNRFRGGSISLWKNTVLCDYRDFPHEFIGLLHPLEGGVLM